MRKSANYLRHLHFDKSRPTINLHKSSPASKMTYIVSSGALNSTHSLKQKQLVANSKHVGHSL